MYIKRNNPTGAGRKGHWRPEMEKQVYHLALLGATDRQIAEFFGINVNIVDYWKTHNKDFQRALKRGKTEADSKVAKALYKRAIGYSHPDSIVLQNRVKEYDEKGRVVREATEPLVVNIIKHYPPDSWACLKWLALRNKENWSDVTKMEVTHTHEGEISLSYVQNQLQDPSQFSTEELKWALKFGVMKAMKQIHNQQ